jgi:uncharacterized membrane protein
MEEMEPQEEMADTVVLVEIFFCILLLMHRNLKTELLHRALEAAAVFTDSAVYVEAVGMEEMGIQMGAVVFPDAQVLLVTAAHLVIAGIFLKAPPKNFSFTTRLQKNN